MIFWVFKSINKLILYSGKTKSFLPTNRNTIQNSVKEKKKKKKEVNNLFFLRIQLMFSSIIGVKNSNLFFILFCFRER